MNQVPPSTPPSLPPDLSYRERSSSRRSRSGRRGWRSNKHGPLFSAIWFSLVGFYWFVLVAAALVFLRPHPLVHSDYIVAGIGMGVSLFYFIVSFGVFLRRRYILNMAFVCAGFGLLAFPIGTIFSIMLLSDLVSRKHDFTK